MKPNIHAIHIADGFADDCDDLIQKCLQTETLNYQIFCNVWKDTKFASLFHGRTSGAELAEMSEEYVFIAKRYMLGNTCNFEESVAGLFLVYALLHLQPYANFAKLRITPADMTAINVIQDIARVQKRYDVLYILGSLLIDGPAEYHLADREYGLENGMKKVFTARASIDREGIRPKGVFFRQNEELDLVREVSGLERRYHRAKALIHGKFRPDKTLDYVNESMASEMTKSLKALINGRQDEEPSQNRGEDVQSIKQRAMRDAVHDMRHLKTVGESQPAGESSPPKTSNDDENEANDNTTSPKSCRTRSNQGNARRKYNKVHPRWQKGSKKKKGSETDSDSDLDNSFNMPNLSDESDNNISDSENTSNDTTTADGPQEHTTNNNTTIKTETAIVNKLIDLNKISGFVESAGNQIEIEIIDQYQMNSFEENTVPPAEDQNVATVPNESGKVTKKGKGPGKRSKTVEAKPETKLNSSGENDGITEPVTVKAQDGIAAKNKLKNTEKISKIVKREVKNRKFKSVSEINDTNYDLPEVDSEIDSDEPILTRKKERKALKRTVLKSKFKRLGLLPFADLNESSEENSPKKKRKCAR